MDLKIVRDKLIGSKEQRAVSPVIGVILMVAITVILAAVIAAFVLDLGQSQSASASAGVEFDYDGTDVTITYISADRIDDGEALDVDDSMCSNAYSSDLSDVGDSWTCQDYTSGEDITVVGTYQGEDTVVSSWSS